MSWLTNHYDLLRGLHILAAIAWMAGMLYLPRLFVYHCEAERGSQMDLTFQTMERRLLRGIMNPAMIATFIFGAGLIAADGYMRGWGFLAEPWMIAKLAGVIVLIAVHGLLAKARKAFVAGKNTRSGKFWRICNEVPFVAAVVIVLAVTTEFAFY